MCQLNECTQHPCQVTSEMGDTHVYFIRFMAQTPRSEPNELQNLRKNSAAGFFSKNIHNVNRPTLCMAGMALSNASSITPGTSRVNVSECVFMQKNDFLVRIPFDCRFFIQ